ncbi:MAG: sucrase ferredoxin [Nocardioidaceae bacterium]
MTPLCSDGSAAVGEQLEGSAPEAYTWVALEQSGPWGPKALTQSHLDPAVGATLEALAAAHRSRPTLVRRPGRHADEHHAGAPRTVLVASTDPANTWLLAGTVADPALLLDLDWEALAAGDRDGVRRSLPSLDPTEQAQLLVCTNGTRDLCCASKGRPLASGADARAPGRVWEATHTSGHRFAPTSVLLPSGHLHGRLDVDRAFALLEAADRGDTVLEGSRGRSTWPAAAQVAELAVRTATGEVALSALTVLAHAATAEHRWLVDVGHADGRRWRVEVRSEPTDVDRKESCLKAAKPLRRWRSTLRTC